MSGPSNTPPPAFNPNFNPSYDPTQEASNPDPQSSEKLPVQAAEHFPNFPRLKQLSNYLVKKFEAPPAPSTEKASAVENAVQERGLVGGGKNSGIQVLAVPSAMEGKAFYGGPQQMPSSSSSEPAHRPPAMNPNYKASEGESSAPISAKQTPTDRFYLAVTNPNDTDFNRLLDTPVFSSEEVRGESINTLLNSQLNPELIQARLNRLQDKQLNTPPAAQLMPDLNAARQGDIIKLDLAYEILTVDSTELRLSNFEESLNTIDWKNLDVDVREDFASNCDKQINKIFAGDPTRAANWKNSLSNAVSTAFLT